MERYTASQTWYVVFDRTTQRKWWSLFLDRDYGHVSLWLGCDDGCVWVNPLSHCVAIKRFESPVEEMLRQEAEQKPTAILARTVNYGMLWKPRLAEPLTCVSVAKRVLGVGGFVFTPKQLHRKLLTIGAEKIY